jgi:DNA-binding GntR family transcriptional regulator
MPQRKRSKKFPSRPALPLNEQAYRKIKELIVTIRLQPGEQVDEASLAAALGIGRTPTREALFRLVAENLVEVVHGRGFFVRDISMIDLRDLFETMLILERSAIVLATKRIRKEQIERLQQLNADLGRAWQVSDFLQVTRLNGQFHHTVYAATDNRFLKTYLDNLQNQSQRLAYMCFSKEPGGYDITSHAELTLRDHWKLIELFKSRNSAEAVELITEHVRLFHRRVHACTFPSLEGLEAFAPLQVLQAPFCHRKGEKLT